MRKLSFLFLFAAMGLFTTTTFAQEIKENVKAVTVDAIQEKVEIKLSELPEAVTKTLSEQFAEYTAEKAYTATIEDQVVFYVKLSKDDTYTKVTLNANGEVLDQEEIEEK